MPPKGPRRGPQRRRPVLLPHRAKCRFCKLGLRALDYKDIALLQKIITPQARLTARKRSGNCAYHQRQVKVALKRARYMALMAYVG